MSRRHCWLGKHAIYHAIEDFIGMRHMIVDRIHQLFLGVHDDVRLVLLLLCYELTQEAPTLSP